MSAVGRVRDNLNWWSFGVRDNGLIGYVRHLRGYERARRDTLRGLRGKTQEQLIAEVEELLDVKVPR